VLYATPMKIISILLLTFIELIYKGYIFLNKFKLYILSV
jgi:hypothetical protein